MMKRKLPKNWIVSHSKTHPDRVYYFNVKTNQSSWEVPTEDQSEQVTKKTTGPSKKRKKLGKDDDNQVQPTTPEHDAFEKEINGRKKLVAKRSLKCTQEKATEEKETPHMHALREKMLKRKEKNIPPKPQNPRHSKIISKSQPSKSNKGSSDTFTTEESTTASKTNYTPQMQAILQKMQERTSKSTSKSKVEENSNVKDKQEEHNKDKRLRNQSTPKDQEKVVAVTTDKRSKRKQTGQSTILATPMKQSRKSLKKNLGKERMENLRKSLALETSGAESSDHGSQTLQSTTSISKPEKVPSIYKNAEVRLIRLKDRLSKDRNVTNESLSKSQSEKVEKSAEEDVTTVDKLVKRAHENSFYEEMDWEPMEDEKITFEVQAVRTQLCSESHKDISCNVSSNILSSPSLLAPQEKTQLYIVIDTNVFLSNIEAVELAKETTFKTYDRPLIVIPWTVIRELDYIKDNNGKKRSTALCAKARKAVHYINKLFASKHPRIIGQTREDVAKNKQKFSIDCPDDEILQTCLQIRDLKKSVVLLSYDVNLCNKAMIYDVVTLGRNDPFEKIDYLNLVNHQHNSSYSFHNQSGEISSPNSTLVLSQERRFVNEIYDDTKSIIKEFLSLIVSKEMHELYGESWENYVIIKPPWTAVTVLHCAIKHWIAAISESFLRKAEPILKELLQEFKRVSGEVTLKNVSYILHKCNDLVQMLNVDKHRDLMLQASQKIDELRQKCHEFECRLKEQKLRDAVGFEDDAEERERRAQTAFQYFEAAYTFARDICGVAAEAAGMPCSFHYSILNPLPSLDYVKRIQPELAGNVNKLLHSLSAVLEQVNDSCVDHRTLNSLHQTLVTFLPESVPEGMKLTNRDLVPLDVYCCVQQKLEVLKTGLRQLQELSTHFCRLASYRAT